MKAPVSARVLELKKELGLIDIELPCLSTSLYCQSSTPMAKHRINAHTMTCCHYVR